MRDDDTTVPVTASPLTAETDRSVVVLVVTVVDKTSGAIPEVEVLAFDNLDTAEVEALHRYDREMVSDRSLFINGPDRIGTRQRWLARLRRGKAMYLATNKTIWMRPTTVRRTA
jgi:hypothetical protein